METHTVSLLYLLNASVTSAAAQHAQNSSTTDTFPFQEIRKQGIKIVKLNSSTVKLLPLLAKEYIYTWRDEMLQTDEYWVSQYTNSE